MTMDTEQLEHIVTVLKVLADPTRLRILGDGSQSKSYIHVLDVVEAVLLAERATLARFEAYNVATGDYVTVREIADLVAEAVGLRAGDVQEAVVFGVGEHPYGTAMISIDMDTVGTWAEREHMPVGGIQLREQPGRLARRAAGAADD